ncbi:unnamed protein product [Thelazia callipaeda]|uniref:Uncharacterized protein n=1 Tax=Thelazia callipaeda TaxID=103827 RepID=A0A0N5CR78_THECL|nr:unnamed protein product [Thelazia callipaeda]
MPSDRIKRQEIKTLQQRWKMKHTDRAGDIPNCPSIEDIVKMPIEENLPAAVNSATNSTVSTAPPQSSESSAQAQITTTAREISPVESVVPQNSSDTSSLPFRRRISRSRRRQRSRKSSKNYFDVSRSGSDYAIQAPAWERRDDIPMCPDIEHICQLDQNIQEDEMSAQRFSFALYQLVDDFFLLLTKMTELFKNHPRPATTIGFIVASYLIICYLELSIAALVELLAQSTWPIFHAFLLFTERFATSFSSFMRSSDDIVQGAYCDVAEIWCRHFQMMCADRCSFFNLALERLRTK